MFHRLDHKVETNDTRYWKGYEDPRCSYRSNVMKEPHNLEYTFLSRKSSYVGKDTVKTKP